MSGASPVPGRAHVLRAVADAGSQLSARAAETVRGENLYKHAYEVRLIARSLPPSDTICDLGGGLGVNLLALRRLGHTGRLILIDQFDEYEGDNRMGTWYDAGETLRQNGVEVIRQNFWADPQLPLDDASAAAATCFDVVEHLPGHPLRQLGELHRILRPGGTCIISGPNGVSLMKRVKAVSGRYPYAPLQAWLTEPYYEHYREYVRPEYEELLRRSGFVDVMSRASAAVTLCRARRGYWRGRQAAISAVRLALWSLAAVESMVPGVRHTIYAWGRKPQ